MLLSCFKLLKAFRIKPQLFTTDFKPLHNWAPLSLQPHFLPLPSSSSCCIHTRRFSFFSLRMMTYFFLPRGLGTYCSLGQECYSCCFWPSQFSCLSWNITSSERVFPDHSSHRLPLIILFLNCSPQGWLWLHLCFMFLCMKTDMGLSNGPLCAQHNIRENSSADWMNRMNKWGQVPTVREIPDSWVDTLNLNLCHMCHMIHTIGQVKPLATGGEQIQKFGEISARA